MWGGGKKGPIFVKRVPNGVARQIVWKWGRSQEEKGTQTISGNDDSE